MTTCYHPEHRIFFIHIPKCAGTSIGGEFDPFDGAWQGCWLNENIPGWTRQGLPNGHQPVRTIEHWTGKPLEWWDMILVPIRNPFAQQVSQWKFWRLRAITQAKQGLGWHKDDRVAVSCTFEQFVEDPRSNGPNFMVGRKWEQYGGVYRWWMCEHGGGIPENVQIVRVEDLPFCLHQALAAYKYEGSEARMWTELGKYNATEATDWRQHYTPRAYEAVRRKFAWSLATYYPDLLTELDGLSKREEALA